jgi:hypothetical protein
MTERFGPLDLAGFHEVDLPARIAGGAAAALPRGLRPIAFRVDGDAYTYAPAADGMAVTHGDADAHTVVELSHADWSDFVWELRTSFSLFYAERLRFDRGHFGHLAAWEPPLRSVFDGQAVYDFSNPAAVDVDITRSFTLDDSDTALQDFLAEAGFVHIRGVYSPDEIAAIRADVEAGIAAARPDDKKSWWTTVDGVDVCNRVNYLNEGSELIAGLDADPRLQRIGAWAGPDMIASADRNDGHNVVIKVPGASSGLADLPWHRDCGMGGHPVKCPMLNIGIQVDAATAGAGQLHVLAGSHRGTSRLPTPAETEGLPVVALDTEPGDVTVHYGHTLHAAPPPTDRHAAGRRALYVTFVPPLTYETVGPGQGYNDVLFVRDSGHIHHVDELG